VLNGPGLPPRAGSDYEDLRAYGAGRYVPTAPTNLRAFAAQLDLITASEYEDALRACANMDDLRACVAMMYEDLRAYGAGRYVPTAPTDLRAFAAQLDLITASKYEDALPACANMDDLRACVAMMGLEISRMDDEDKACEHELLCVQADMNAACELEAQERRQALDEELELRLAKDHVAFEASRIQAVHSLVAQEQPCAQDKDNAQYLEQENELLCVQAVHSLAAQEGRARRRRTMRSTPSRRTSGCASRRRSSVTAPWLRGQRSFHSWASSPETSRSPPRSLRRGCARWT